MIEWMQKHKKYLIPTIWISGIAFIGAGFVGWGAYDMNRDRSSSILKVGDTTVSVQEYQIKYNDIYNYLNSISGGKLTNEQAKEMNIEEMAIAGLIKDTTFLNFASDLGLRATKEDVAKFIVANFSQDGKFSDYFYKQSVKNMGFTPSEYEKTLTKALTLQKLSSAINLEPRDADLELFTSAEFIQDKLSVEKVDVNKTGISASLDEIKTYWKKNKNKYLTERKYHVDALFLEQKVFDVNDTEIEKFFGENRALYKKADGKLQEFAEAKDFALKDYLREYNKNEALLTYLDVKDGKVKMDQTLVLGDGDFIAMEVANSKLNEINKPFEFDGKNVITKLTKIDEPVAMEFDTASELAKVDLLKEKVREAAVKQAENLLKDFNGTDIGYVTRDSAPNTDLLSGDEFKKLIADLFSRNNMQGYILSDDKIIAYKITDQKLQNPEKFEQYKDLLSTSISGLLNTNLQDDLFKELGKRYKTERYYKGSKGE